MSIFSKEKTKPITQEGRALKMLRAAGLRGVANHEFARAGLLRYGAFLKNLRDEGYKITKEREQLPNGHYTNTWRYFLIEV